MRGRKRRAAIAASALFAGGIGLNIAHGNGPIDMIRPLFIMVDLFSPRPVLLSDQVRANITASAHHQAWIGWLALVGIVAHVGVVWAVFSLYRRSEGDQP